MAAIATLKCSFHGWMACPLSPCVCTGEVGATFLEPLMKLIGLFKAVVAFCTAHDQNANRPVFIDRAMNQTYLAWTIERELPALFYSLAQFPEEVTGCRFTASALIIPTQQI